MIPDQLIGNLGDVHLYLNHIEQAKEQIGREMTHDDLLGSIILKQVKTREPYKLPKLELNDSWKLSQYYKCFGDVIKHENIKLLNYLSHPEIKAPLSN
jgi:thymidylate synthase